MLFDLQNKCLYYNLYANTYTNVEKKAVLVSLVQKMGKPFEFLQEPIVGNKLNMQRTVNHAELIIRPRARVIGVFLS